MTTTPYTPAITPTRYAVNSLLAENLTVLTWVDCNGVRWPLSGGLAPIPGAQNGVVLKDIKGFTAPFKHIDHQSARQDGVDYQDTVYEPLELDMNITVSAQDTGAYRRVWSSWVDGWDPKRQGRLSVYTQDSGEWWVWLRLLKETQATLGRGPAKHTVQEFDWTGRADFPFWASFPSSSGLVASSSTTLHDPLGVGPNNFLPLWNRGNVATWPTYIFQGPGTITIADIMTSAPVTFGPLTAGQSALIVTLPRLRSIRELTTNTNLYPLLTGRFSTPIPAATAVNVRVTVTGAVSGVTAVDAQCIPYRTWPE